MRAVWTADTVASLAGHGLPLDRFLLVFDGGELAACGAIWDQREFRQTVIRGYSRPLGLARPMANIAQRLLGRPGLPPVGSVLAHAFLSPLAFHAGAEGMLADFVEACFPPAVRMGLEYLTLALPATDPRLAVLQRRFSTRVWRSRLYRVDWSDDPRAILDPGGPAFLPDVALL